MGSFGRLFQGIKGNFVWLIIVSVGTTAILGLIATSSLDDLKENAHRIQTVRLVRLLNLVALRKSTSDAIRLCWSAVAMTEDPKIAKEKIIAANEMIQKSDELEKINNENINPLFREKFNQAIGFWKTIEHSAKLGLAEVEKGNAKEAKAHFVVVAAEAPKMTADLEEILSGSTALIQEDVLQTDRTASRSFTIMLGLVIAGGLALIVIGILFSVRLTRNLTRITSSLRRNGGQVLQASEQLSGASQALSSGSVESASSLEETVSALEEISSTVKMNADNSREAASLSEAASKTANLGESEIQSLIQSMNEIAKGSRQIEEIINVIDDIAFQTNLLALNAAVEAARAGEQGKGFAVVADAVRNLAQRSATSAKDISNLIRLSVEKTDRGAKVADSSGTVLREIVSSVQKVSDLINEIATASQEQSRGISQISKAMNELDHTTQQNAASAEEVASSSEELSAQATMMQKEVTDMEVLLLGQVHHNTGHVDSVAAASDSASSFELKSIAKSHSKKGVSPKMRVVHNSQQPKTKSKAEEMIPFDDLEPAKKVGTTDGF